jgi:LytS/YehU family sensor histidine kinase
MRSILNNTRESNISLQKEIEMLTLYLELEKLRFGKKLDYCIHVDMSLREGTIFIPTMIVQPFIENAMLHGIMHKDCFGEINVSFLDRENFLEIEVKDNGIGRNAARQLAENKNDGHTSMGIEVTRARLKALSTDAENAAGVEIFDLEYIGENMYTEINLNIEP